MGTIRVSQRSGNVSVRTPAIVVRRWGTSTLVLAALAPFSPLAAQDCNLNGVGDSRDVEGGVSEDCNGDGVPDECESVPLLIGAVGGPTPLGGEPRRLASGDFNGDGLGDLALGSWLDSTGMESRLTVFLGGGAGDFDTERTFETSDLSEVRAADLDGDSDLDLVTLSGTVLAVHSNGGGGFESAVAIGSSSAPQGLVVADVDLDGALDLVTRDPGEGRVTWYQNLGKGTLGEGRFMPRTFEVSEASRSLRPFLVDGADFDGDGDVDLALTGGTDRAVTIVENTGNYENAEEGEGFSVSHALRSSGFIQAIATGDFDSDGFVDLLGAASRQRLQLWLSRAGEGFDEPSVLSLDVPVLAVSDVDGDGAADVITGGANVQVRLLQSRGDGTFLTPLESRVNGGVLAVADFDGDGDADLAVADTAPGRLSVLLQGEPGPPRLDPTSYGASGRVHFIDIVDLDSDAILDVVTANTIDQNSSLFFGKGDGSLEDADVRQKKRDLWAVATADLDHDGDADLVFRSGDGGGTTYPDTRATCCLTIFSNKGGRAFGDPVLIETIGHVTEFLLSSDVDGDGNVDVLVPTWNSDRLAIHYGDGLGGLAEAQVLEVGSSSHWVAAGDLDGDGDLDVVVANRASADLSMLFQTRPRDFQPAVSVPLDGVPYGVELADVDRDGDLDIVAGSGGGGPADEDSGLGFVAIFLNPGDGRIDAPTHRFPVGRDIVQVTVADLDQDSFLDVVTLDGVLNSNEAGELSILRGRGDGTFSAPQHVLLRSVNPRHIRARDMDADGDVDLVVGFRRNQSVTVLRNQSVAPIPAEEFLHTICTPLDFERIAVPDSLPTSAASSERRTKYLLPAREDPELLATLFVNVARFPLERDFLREVFPERFGDLSDLGFTDLALRRATRDYFSGAIRRLRLKAEGDDPLADGGESPKTVTAYGFDVLTDAMEAGELLSLEETRELYARLRQSFTVEPLVYFPTTPEAREAARGWGPPDFPAIIAEDEPEPPTPAGNPTFLLDIPPDTILCGVFAVAGGGRGPRDEYELKSTVRLRQGTITLPTESDTFAGELFEEVLFGPERLTAEPQDTGTFRVVRVPGSPPQENPNQESPVTTFRFTYSQPFRLADGRHLELEVVSPLVFRARGDEPLSASRPLPPEFFTVLKGREPLQARLDGESLLRYGSCDYASLPRWGIEAELEDGTRLSLEERFEEAASLNDTGPASLVGGVVTAGPERRVVTDYVDLIYSAARHNTLVDYWVILDPPMVLDGALVHAMELRAEEKDPALARPAEAAYLGADFEVLSRPQVTRFERIALAQTPFQRGDAAGDGGLKVVDAIAVLRYLFEREGELLCLKAADANDDGRLNIVDPIVAVSQLFGGGDALPEPFPDCGTDPTEDALSCRSAPSCR
jgi:hypothetical protein